MEQRRLKKLNNSDFSSHKITSESIPDMCKICGELASQKKLVVTNELPSKENNADSPLRVMFCIDCFLLKTFSELCVRESEKIKEKQTETTELRQSRRKENRFRRFVYERLQNAKNKRWEESDLINSGAEAVDISTTTAGRYLNKMCSTVGVLKREGDGESVFVTYNMKGLLDLIKKITNDSLGDLR